MEISPHGLKKKLAALALSLVLLLTCLPGALAVDLNVDAGFYFKQSRGGTCTLASAAMMLRYTFALEEAALRIETAVEKVLAQGYRTTDIYEPGTQKVGTKEMGDAVLKNL